MDQKPDLRFYFELLRRRLLVMGAVFFVVLGASVATAILIPPIFRSEAKIIVETQQIPTDLVRPTTASFADERIQVIRQLVTTREGLLTIAEKFALFPKRRASLSATELVDLIRDRISIEPLALAPGNSRSRTAPNTFAFTVGFEYEDPDVTGRVANELVTLILNENTKSRIAQAAETTKFLDREVTRKRGELSALEGQVAEYKLKNAEALPERLQLQSRVLDRLSAEKTGIIREIQLLDEQTRLLKFELSVRSASSGTQVVSLDAATLAKQLEALRAELSQKSAIYTANHPDIRALRQQIETLSAQIAPPTASDVPEESVKTPIDPSKLDLDSRLVAEKIATAESRGKFLETQRKELDTRIEALNALIEKGPAVQSGLADLLQQRDGILTGLNELNAKLEAARLGEKLEEDQFGQRFQVIEQPITPQEPIRPNRPLLMLSGLGASFAAAGGAVLLLEMLNRSIRRSADLSSYLNIRPLVTIPYFVSKRETRLRRRRIATTALLVLIAIAAALAVVHFLYMPLDIAAFKVFRRLGL